jgi:type IV pilus assembly protein PilY1
MKPISKRLALGSVGILSALAATVPASADDTELFLGAANSVNTAQPNILFIIDDSGSMGGLVSTQANYDPKKTYSGACGSGQVYYSTTGSAPDCSTPSWFNKSALVCKAGLDAIAATGIYGPDTLAQYDDSSSTARTWVKLVNSQKDQLVECKADYGVHGDGSPTTDVYPINGVASGKDAWSADPKNANAITWGSTAGTNTTYTLYDGNYLNWLATPPALATKLSIVQNVATTLLTSLHGVNVGMMTFNNDQGGYVVVPMQDIATARADMISKVNALTAYTDTPLSETLYEAALYYMGRPVDYGNPASVAGSRKPNDLSTYLSPLQASCQHNFIVYLTDGEPTSDTDADGKIQSLVDAKGQSFSTLTGSGTCDVETFPPEFHPVGGNCLDDLAQFLYKGDLSPLPDQQNVITYTIGFTVDLQNLAETAARGGGAYYTANDTASLTNAFTSIVTQILDKGSTFISPTVSVNSFNRTQNLNDLFVSLFKPTDSFHWPGNLKKYRLNPGDATIVDATGTAAVDPATGFFKDSARSLWSAKVDGNDVTSGGAANLIPPSGSRVVVTNLGNKSLTDPSNRVAASNSAITDAMLGTGAPGDPTRSDVLSFINNVDVADVNGDHSTTDPRDQMGDPLHSAPTTVIYGPTTDDAVVYFATNDGFLHAIDAKTGIEKWAFIPKEFLGTQVLELLDRTAATKNYAIDGSLRVQMKANNDGTIDPASEKVFLYFGLRRGGDSYYALDVTRPDSPQLMWHLDHTNLPGVGQTWSTPVPTRMLINGSGQSASNFVLVLGGGYEPDQDDVTASTDATGNSIYVVDSETGALLWQGTKTGGTKSFNATGKAMDYSIPAEVKVVDFDGDGYADRMYAADMGGQVWRFDIANGQSAANLITGGVIAQLGAASLTPPAPAGATRRFYYSPDVALVANKDFNFIHVGIGSGWRAHPLSLANQDRFYAIRDYNGVNQLTQAAYDAITPYKDSDLVDITDNVKAKVPQGQPGWQLQLRDGGWIGEKVLAESRTFNNQVMFTTFRPSQNATSCEPQAGTNRLYIVSLFDGSPVNNLDGSVDNGPLTATDRFTEFKGSISSEVEFIFPQGEPGCVGDQCAPPPVACVDLFCFPPGFPNNPVRTFWSEQNAD